MQENDGQDSVVIENLHIDTFVGVFEWEKRVRQTLRLDLELFLESNAIARIAVNDQLVSSSDYTVITNRIQAFVTAHHFDLIETLGDRLARVLLDEFTASGVKIRVRKPSALAGGALVSISLERST